MRFRIAPEHKEQVEILRPSAFADGSLESVASNVVCMIVPGSGAGVNVESGVPIERTTWLALLEERNDSLAIGDIIARSVGTRFRVRGIRKFSGGDVMQLELTEHGVL